MEIMTLIGTDFELIKELKKENAELRETIKYLVEQVQHFESLSQKLGTPYPHAVESPFHGSI